MRKAIVLAVVLVLVASLFAAGKISITYAPKNINQVAQNPGNEWLIPEEDIIEEPRPLFPETLTVLDAKETTPVNIRKSPDQNAASLGVAYGSLMHVEVLEELENGFTKVSTWDYRSMEPIEGYVASKYVKSVKPEGKYQVLVSLKEQKTHIYKDGILYKTFVNSTGAGDAYTPKGIYLIGDRGGSFFSGKYQQGAYNWVRFNHNYLFHSIPFDANKKLIPEEAAKLGEKASHGCIRHSIEDAQWFYENITRGTLVVIQD